MYRNFINPPNNTIKLTLIFHTSNIYNTLLFIWSKVRTTRIDWQCIKCSSIVLINHSQLAIQTECPTFQRLNTKISILTTLRQRALHQQYYFKLTQLHLLLVKLSVTRHSHFLRTIIRRIELLPIRWHSNKVLTLAVSCFLISQLIVS